MTRRLQYILHLAVLLLPTLSSGQFFQRSFGWGPFNTAPSCTYRPDGHYGLSGSFSSTGSGQTDFVLMQIDTNGTFQWAKAYGTAGIDNVTKLNSLPDSGYLLAGFTNGFSANNDYDGYIVRTDATGDTVWTRTFGTPHWDFIGDLVLLSDGNYLIAGKSESSSFGNTAGWLQTVSPAGTALTSKLFTDADHLLRFQRHNPGR